MRQPLVAGNWKMNGNTESIKELVSGIVAGMSDVKTAEVVVSPSFVYLAQVVSQLGDCGVSVASQDMNDQESGAHTGEIAGSMLTDIGCKYAIIGHSERRSIYGEDDAFTASKFMAAQKQGLIPILCVGESLEQRESGATEQVVAEQLDAVINAAGVAALANAVVAYEPVWAIGTGKTATPDQAQAVHAFIRNKIAGLDAEVAAGLRILYGGSMNAANAAELLSMTDIDGGLIGGASLKADSFLTICRAANAD